MRAYAHARSTLTAASCPTGRNRALGDGKIMGLLAKNAHKYYYKLNHAGGEDKNLFPGFFFREESVIFACKETNKV